MYLAVNPSGEFVLFKNHPARKTMNELVDDKDNIVFDHYGNSHYMKKATGKVFECWYDSFSDSYGNSISKESLSEDLKKRK